MLRVLVPGLLVAAMSLPVSAQESGGLSLSPEALAVGGPRGLAQPMRMTLPGFTASDLQAMPTPAERRQRNSGMVARLRGDGGFVDGFGFGQPLAASRQPPPPAFEPLPPIIIDQRTKVVNTFEGPVAVTVGDNNIVQQQGASGSGPVAQQQVATVSGRTRRGPRGGEGAGSTSGAVNIVTPEGNIVQSSPGARLGSPAPR